MNYFKSSQQDADLWQSLFMGEGTLDNIKRDFENE